MEEYLAKVWLLKKKIGLYDFDTPPLAEWLWRSKFLTKFLFLCVFSQGHADVWFFLQKAEILYKALHIGDNFYFTIFIWMSQTILTKDFNVDSILPPLFIFIFLIARVEPRSHTASLIQPIGSFFNRYSESTVFIISTIAICITQYDKYDAYNNSIILCHNCL